MIEFWPDGHDYYEVKKGWNRKEQNRTRDGYEVHVFRGLDDAGRENIDRFKRKQYG